MAESTAVVEGLCFRYGSGPPVLDGIEFAASPGEVVGLLGRNGSGKTTLLRLLAGLIQATAGQLATSHLPTVVFDRTPFQESLSGRENLLLGLALRGRGELAEDVPRWLAAIDLSDDADRPVAEYSLGMRRRLAMVEALSCGPQLTLLDEPTLGLDPQGRHVLGELLRASASDGGTILIATNDAVFAERECSRIVILGSGQILADGPSSDLIAALNAPTIIEVELDHDPPSTTPPAGLTVISTTLESLVVTGASASSQLPELCAWLSEAGGSVRAIKIREPGLDDVFHRLTGTRLRSEDGEMR
ncbi:MAG: ABC transporter ATP-binding protein [Gemmatimonadales bacterium]|nr:MAG: ABC transporter ATP-binding protein [Gemmatimonadales bacterium]